MELLRPTPLGPLCERGGFHLDPVGPVERAVITHASRLPAALASREAWAPAHLAALAPGVRALPLGQPHRLGEVELTYLASGSPASAVARLAAGGAAWAVVPGALPDGPPPAPNLLLDATYALPIFRWPPEAAVAAEVLAWWDANRAAQRAALLLAEPWDEALRLLAGLAALPGARDRPVSLHPTLEPIVAAARAAGRALAPTEAYAATVSARRTTSALVLAPPAELEQTTLARLGAHETALASGRMQLRGVRRRLAIDRGFVLSSRPDWPALLALAARAERVAARGAHAGALARALTEAGRRAEVWGHA